MVSLGSGAEREIEDILKLERRVKSQEKQIARRAGKITPELIDTTQKTKRELQ